MCQDLFFFSFNLNWGKLLKILRYHLSGVGCIIPVSIYLCTVRLIGLTDAWQNYKPLSCKKHEFSEMQFHVVSNCFTAVLYEPLSKLYIYTIQLYIFPIVGLLLFYFFLCGGGGGGGGGGKIQELGTRLMFSNYKLAYYLTVCSRNSGPTDRCMIWVFLAVQTTISCTTFHGLLEIWVI